MYPDMHVQLGESPTARQIEFGPQGAGSQGAFFGGGSSTSKHVKLSTEKNPFKIFVSKLLNNRKIVFVCCIQNILSLLQMYIYILNKD